MRALSLALLALAGGCSTERCKAGTVHLTYALPAGAESADTVDVTLAIGGGAAQTKSFQRKASARSIEIDFAAYPSGQSLTLTLTARAGDRILASTMQTTTVAPDCTELSLSLAAELGDLGSADLGGIDLGADLAITDLATADLTAQDLSGADLSSTPDLAYETGLTLLAGKLGGIGNADGVGAAARFNQPMGAATDLAGNLYVADKDHVIRKIVIASGEVTTLAGLSGVRGHADGTGAAARFWNAQWLTGDGAGNLFVTDEDTVRQIVIATGAVTTLAGTPGNGGSNGGVGPAAEFNSPQGITSDQMGNLYVADGSCIVRKIVVNTAVVTTIAGTAGMNGTADGTGAAARFMGAQGIVSDGPGDLFLTDGGRIRHITTADNAVTTLASPAPNAALDGIAGDGAGNLYVADFNQDVILKVVIATGTATTLAGTTGLAGSADGTGQATLFNQPWGIAGATTGKLYVTDYSSSTIRQIALADTAVTTLAGAPFNQGSADGIGSAARFDGSQGVTSDGTNLYVADNQSFTIRQISLATSQVTTLAGSPGTAGSVNGRGSAAQFTDPIGITNDGAGNLYVADESSIRQIVAATGQVTTLIGASAGFTGLEGITYDGEGSLYVVDNNEIYRVVIATGTVTALAGSGSVGSTDGIGTAASFDEPIGLTCDRAGNLFVVCSDNSTIRQIVIATATVTTLAGSPDQEASVDGVGAAARFNNPTDLVSDGAGSLYVADTLNSTIRKIDVATATVTTVIGVGGRIGVQPGPFPASLSAPAFLTMIGADLAITDTGENVVLVAHHL